VTSPHERDAHKRGAIGAAKFVHAIHAPITKDDYIFFLILY
jgi:hypothetical protein